MFLQQQSLQAPFAVTLNHDPDVHHSSADDEDDALQPTTLVNNLPMAGRSGSSPDEAAVPDLVDFSSLVAVSMMDMPSARNHASSPASPGQSCRCEPTKMPAFSPSPRPSSTPFPRLEERSSAHDSACPNIRLLHHARLADHQGPAAQEPDPALMQPPPARHFTELPLEVHEAIVDHLFGFSIAPTSSRAMKIASLSRGWGTALRHSRRRELADLALVSRTWTLLIQQRLYRHIKLRATLKSLDDAMMHFARKEHLACHVKHVEAWFPVFQPMYGPPTSSNTLSLPTVTTSGLTNAIYVLPADNCTLDEVFRFIDLVLPDAQVLTLEGGERRKAPKVAHFYHAGKPTPAAAPPPPPSSSPSSPSAASPSSSTTTSQPPFRQHHPHSSYQPRHLCPVPSVRTLITRGQWNLMRSDADFAAVLRALPNLEEWQGSYSKPKSKSYITLSHYIPHLPAHITRLSLCLENDYRREAVTPAFFPKVAAKTHLCTTLAHVLPRLEHFSYTGRICARFFDVATVLSDPLTSRLKSVDMTVKNCCRTLRYLHPHHHHHDEYTTADPALHGSGSGIHDMGFIDAFEKLVLAAIRFLGRHEGLRYVRIRFVDLDSLLPPLNPYFLLKQDQCSGLWSDLILAELARHRPDVTFAELSESFGNIVYSKEGRMVITTDNPMRGRILSLKVSNYQALANRMTIQ